MQIGDCCSLVAKEPAQTDQQEFGEKRWEKSQDFWSMNEKTGV